MTFVRGLAAVAALFAVAPLRAESPPPPAPPKPFTVPARHDLSLDNGGKVTLVPYGAVPKAVVQWVVRAGNVNEGAEHVWLADTTGELMREGTATRSAQQLAEAAAAMGGDVDLTVGPDQTVVSVEVLAEFAPRAVALLGDLVEHPLMPAAELPRIKEDLLRKLAMMRVEPGLQARQQFDETIYKGHPYGNYFPTDAMISGYTVDDVKKFYETNFGAARTHLYVVGKFDAAAVEAAARQSLGDWRRGTDAPPVSAQPPVAPAVRQVDRPGAVQSTLIVGLPVVTPKSDDYVALVVTDSLLGGSFGSRITSNIREQKGYTYSPRSQLEEQNNNGTWSEHADVTTKDTGASLREIFAEITRLQKEAPPVEELRGIQQFLAGTFVITNSSRYGILSRLRFVDLHQLDDNWLRDYVQRVMAVTPADVQRMAKQYLDGKKMTVVVVGDRKAVDAQLAPWTKPAHGHTKRAANGD